MKTEKKTTTDEHLSPERIIKSVRSVRKGVRDYNVKDRTSDLRLRGHPFQLQICIRSRSLFDLCMNILNKIGYS